MTIARVGAQDIVEPSSKNGGNAEIVHGCPDDDGIGGAKLGDQFVRQSTGRQLGLSGRNGSDPRHVELGQVRNGGGSQVSVDDRCIRMHLDEAPDGFVDDNFGCGTKMTFRSRIR
jgi:hypothetical protein